ncbi:MAG: hypothetical protein IKD16_04330, partial [Bacteroidales bacterium]|nr:hypothetical protein [Bacteroidales bacterium]
MGGKITALFSNTNIIQRFAVLLLPLLFIALSPCNSHAQSHNASAYDHLVNPKIQKEHMEKHPHQIPMILMADVINGYKTIFPIPLAQGAAFE